MRKGWCPGCVTRSGVPLLRRTGGPCISLFSSMSLSPTLARLWRLPDDHADCSEKRLQLGYGRRFIMPQCAGDRHAPGELSACERERDGNQRGAAGWKRVEGEGGMETSGGTATTHLPTQHKPLEKGGPAGARSPWKRTDLQRPNPCKGWTCSQPLETKGHRTRSGSRCYP